MCTKNAERNTQTKARKDNRIGKCVFEEMIIRLPSLNAKKVSKQIAAQPESSKQGKAYG
jgi:hypothetical protein